MDSVLPFRRFASWVIDRLMFLAVAVAILFVIRELDARLGIRGPESLSFDVYEFFVIQAPLALVIAYALWLLFIIKFGQPGRILTGHRGADISGRIGRQTQETGASRD